MKAKIIIVIALLMTVLALDMCGYRSHCDACADTHALLSL